ncbi:MAG TPA: hypothetical protein VHZ78_11910 [Rhizomicrobium sp.]|nr:hypothetical protein [Rhizomicrobium sp.]
MRLRLLAVAAIVALGLAGCEDGGLPEQGFLTHAFDSDSDDAPPVAANGCTPAGCPQAPGFCAARGYSPGSDGYQRCIVSVESDLRKGMR